MFPVEINDKYKYLLNVIDIFALYLSVPLKDKTSKSIAVALTLFQNRKPITIQSDKCRVC